MLKRIKQRLSEEKGFTLIELLVVVLIIGILAAIALPVFLGQQEKGQDSSAKSNARNLVSQVESCATDNDGSYVNCAAPTDTGLPIGPGQGEVQVVGQPTQTGYTVTATSKSTGEFTITKSTTNGVTTIQRTCSRAGKGGCPQSRTW